LAQMLNPLMRGHIPVSVVSWLSGDSDAAGTINGNCQGLG